MTFRTSRTHSQLLVIDAKLGCLYGRGECLRRMWLLKEEAAKTKAKFGPFVPTNKNQRRSKRLRWLAERWATRAAEGSTRFQVIARMV